MRVTVTHQTHIYIHTAIVADKGICLCTALHISVTIDIFGPTYQLIIIGFLKTKTIFYGLKVFF